LAASKSAARQLIQGGGVYLRLAGLQGPTERITDINYAFAPKDGAILRVGKLKFIRLETR
jgi:tyrosyl-tRNA synthetase